MPAIYLWEYKIWLLGDARPSSAGGLRFGISRSAITCIGRRFFTVGRPLLIGSLIIGLPSAAIVYFICRGIGHEPSGAQGERELKFSRRRHGSCIIEAGRCALLSRRRRPGRTSKLMKSLLVIASSLLLCSCADMVVTKTYTSSTGSRRRSTRRISMPKTRVRYPDQLRGRGERIRPRFTSGRFCIDSAIFRGDEAASEGEMPIRKALTPVAICR